MSDAKALPPICDELIRAAAAVYIVADKEVADSIADTIRRAVACISDSVTERDALRLRRDELVIEMAEWRALCEDITHMYGLESGALMEAVADNVMGWRTAVETQGVYAEQLSESLVRAHDVMLMLNSSDLGRSDREALEAARVHAKAALAQNPNPAGPSGTAEASDYSPEASGAGGAGTMKDELRAAAERMVQAYRDWMAGCDNETRTKDVMAAHIALRDALAKNPAPNREAPALAPPESGDRLRHGSEAGCVHEIARESFWLIEGPDGKSFYAGGAVAHPLDANRHWTSYAPEAVRFTSAAHAQRFVDTRGVPGPYAIREHVFVSSDTRTQSGTQPGAWLIFFDDTEVKPETFTGEGAEAAARARFASASTNWNAHLFALVESNSRDAAQANGFVHQVGRNDEELIRVLERARDQLMHLAGPFRNWPKRVPGMEHPLDTIAAIQAVIVASRTVAGTKS